MNFNQEIIKQVKEVILAELLDKTDGIRKIIQNSQKTWMN